MCCHFSSLEAEPATQNSRIVAYISLSSRLGDDSKPAYLGLFCIRRPLGVSHKSSCPISPVFLKHLGSRDMICCSVISNCQFFFIRMYCKRGTKPKICIKSVDETNQSQRQIQIPDSSFLTVLIWFCCLFRSYNDNVEWILDYFDNFDTPWTK